jgi:hypothetical protein
MVAIKKAFLMVAGSAVQKFGANLDEHQQLLMAASDMLIEIWLKVLSLEQRNWQRIKEDKVQEQIAMAKLYLYQAVDIVTQKEKKVISFVEGDEQRMMLMGLRRFTKYYMPNIVALRETITKKLVSENEYCF